MTSVTPPPKKQRDKALQRALKFTKLFQEETFEAVLTSLDTGNRADFNNALDTAGIKILEDQDWLYNYLQHMNEPKPEPKDPKHPTYWYEAPEEAAAGTGW